MRKMDGEVMEKYRVSESKTSAYKGRGEPMYWRIFKNSKKLSASKWVKTVGRESTRACLRE